MPWGRCSGGREWGRGGRGRWAGAEEEQTLCGPWAIRSARPVRAASLVPQRLLGPPMRIPLQLLLAWKGLEGAPGVGGGGSHVVVSALEGIRISSGNKATSKHEDGAHAEHFLNGGLGRPGRAVLPADPQREVTSGVTWAPQKGELVERQWTGRPSPRSAGPRTKTQTETHMCVSDI